MKKHIFTYGILGHRFFSTPFITEYAFNPGDAELQAFIKLQAQYPGKLITHFKHV